MLDVGTRISIALEEGQEPVVATIVHCSATGRSCKIELEDGEVKSLNLPKHQYTVLEPEAAPVAAEDEPGQGDSESENEDSSEEEEAMEEPIGADASDLESSDPELDMLDTEEAAPLAAFQNAADPAAFLQGSDELAGLARQAARALYAVASKTAPKEQALPELYVEGFDPEQIWLQLDMLGGPALKRVRRLLRKLRDKEDSIELLSPENEDALNELLGLENEDSMDDKEAQSDDEEEAQTDEEEVAGLSDIDYDAMLAGDGKANDLEAPAKSAPRALAVVEDDYLKLDEMEAFLQDAERQAAVDDQEEVEEEELPNPKMRRRKATSLGLAEVQHDEYDAGIARDVEEGADAKYEDFFGPRKGPRRAPLKGPLETLDAGAQDEDEPEGESEEDDELDERLEPAFGDEEEEEQDLEDGEEVEEEDEEEDAEIDEGMAVDESDEEDAAAGYERLPSGGTATSDALSGRLSTHEQQQAKIAERIKTLEQEALAARDWFLRGEIGARQRPKNSALEIDLDYETTVAPPPAPSEEATSTLEERIRERIRERRFDDVIRVAPPPPPRAEAPEIDDKKSSKNLAELYAADYERQVLGVSEDRDEPVRAEARRLFALLAGKLDALSHAHFRPAPVVAEAGAPSEDAPAILMEEIAPQVASEAGRRAPEEVHAAPKEDATPAETELEREERKRRRAQYKRATKKARAAREEERAQRAVSAGGTAPILGRKSDQQANAASQKGKRKAKGTATVQTLPKRGHFTKSAAVFGGLQAMQENGGHKKTKPREDGPSAKLLRL